MDGTWKFARRRRGGVAIGLAGLIAVLALTGCAGSGAGPRHDPLQEPTVSLAEIRSQRLAAPAEPYWPFQLAAQQWAAGAGELARANLDTALTLDPDYAPAAALLAKIQYEAGEYEAGAERLQSYLDRNAEAPDALRVALALHLQALAEPERAASVLAACGEQNGPVRTARACAVLQSDDFAAGLPLAEAAVADNPRSAANHNNLGISLLYAGQPVAARESFQRALEIDPGLPGALYNLAIVENFYFFDRAAGRDYFQRYQQAAHNRPPADPDELGALLANPADGVGTQAALTAAAAGGSHD